MNQQQALAALIKYHTAEDGVHPTCIPRISLIRASRPTVPLHILHEPALCIVAQGKKQVFLGEQIFHYDAQHYLIVSVDLPIGGQVIEAEPAEPYLCFKLSFDVARLSELVVEMGLSSESGQHLELTRFSGGVRTWQLGRLLESVYLLVFGRTQVAERRMKPLAIKEYLDVIEDRGRELLSSLPLLAVK